MSYAKGQGTNCLLKNKGEKKKKQSDLVPSGKPLHARVCLHLIIIFIRRLALIPEQLV